MASYVRAGFGRDLAALIADLESVEIGLGRIVAETLVPKLDPLVAEIRALMPFDPSHRGWRAARTRQSRRKRRDPGHIRDSVRGGMRGSTLVIEAGHPGGAPTWWAPSHIEPKGSVIELKHRPGTGHDFESAAAEEVGRAVQQAYDRLAREHGL